MMDNSKFNKSKYDHDYIRSNYDRMTFLVPKGKREVIKSFAKEQDKSVNQLIVSALEAEYNINLSKPKE